VQLQRSKLAAAGVPPRRKKKTMLKKRSDANGNKTFQSHHRVEKENMKGFIGKKRQMFLIQMSLDTKRDEIQKLEEMASQKEEALRKSEMMLEEDAMRFDAFLKENDRKAHDALKIADKETRDKQDKNLKIKKLRGEITKVSLEIQGYDAELGQCLMYKKFLDELTPPEFIQNRERAKREANGNAEALKRASKMYFQRPEQLLNLFAHLEERNLFLIQNAQETEEALEELRQKFSERKTEMETKTAHLEENIQGLESKIKSEENKASSLARRRKANSAAGVQQKLLRELSDKVKLVYEQCGFDPDNQSDTVDQLREIEGWMEYLLQEIYQMDYAKVAHEEREKQNQRRVVKRNERQAKNKRSYEDRLAKSTARAKAEVVRPSGKPVMFRSPPMKRKVKKETKHERDEETEELLRYFTQ
jgi:hypothetical protein